MENLKRWHWALIGLLVGGLFGYAWAVLQSPADDGVVETLSQQRFEERLLGRANPFDDPARLRQEEVDALRAGGVPLLRGLVLYPPDDRGRTWVTGEVMTRRPTEVRVDPKDPDQFLPAEAEYRRFRFDPPAPYKPIVTVPGAEPACVDVNWNPELRRVRGGSPQRRRLPTSPGWGTPGFTPAALPPNAGWYDTWSDAYRTDPGWRDPGDAGAELRVRLRPGSYRFAIHFDRQFRSSDDGARTTVTLNGKPVGPLAKARPNDPFVWQADVPAGVVTGTGEQVLSVSRQGGPIHVNRIELFDPAYTFARYMAEVRQAVPDAPPVGDPRWRTRPVTVAMFALGGLVLVGGVWPTVIQLLVGAGFARPPKPKEPAYDLDRFGHTSEAVAEAPPPVETDAALASRVEQLEEELLADLAATEATRREEPAMVAPPVRDLKAEPLEPVTEAAKPGADVTYAGEYYPVAHKTSQGKDEKA